MVPNEIWSCYHKNNTPHKNYKPIIVVEIIGQDSARVIVNTYDNYFSEIQNIKNLEFNYRFR